MDLSTILTKFLIYPSHNWTRYLFILGSLLILSGTIKHEMAPTIEIAPGPILSSSNMALAGLVFILFSLVYEIVFRSIVTNRLIRVSEEIRCKLGESRYELVDHYYNDTSLKENGRLILIDKTPKEKCYYWVRYGWTADTLSITSLWKKKSYIEVPLEEYTYNGMLEDRVLKNRKLFV